MKELEIHPDSAKLIQEYVCDPFATTHPAGCRQYIDFVKEYLGVENDEDLVIICPHPDNEALDEEGWSIKTFFPASAHIRIDLIHDDIRMPKIKLNNFAIGAVFSVIYENHKFVADCNASPYCVYGLKSYFENNPQEDGQGKDE